MLLFVSSVPVLFRTRAKLRSNSAGFCLNDILSARQFQRPIRTRQVIDAGDPAAFWNDKGGRGIKRDADSVTKHLPFSLPAYPIAAGGGIILAFSPFKPLVRLRLQDGMFESRTGFIRLQAGHGLIDPLDN